MPSIDHLRASAAAQGIEPTDADLAAVQAFLATVLPALVEIEERQVGDAPPAGLFLPAPEVP